MARKITEAATRAFFNGDRFSRSNTTVRHDNGRSELRLHGHLIAIRENGTVQLSDAGWQTNTTKERLNGVLSYLGKSRIYQRDWTWYRGQGIEVNSGEFFTA